jgi:hypothetical protein
MGVNPFSMGIFTKRFITCRNCGGKKKKQIAKALMGAEFGLSAGEAEIIDAPWCPIRSPFCLDFSGSQDQNFCTLAYTIFSRNINVYVNIKLSI